MDFVKVKHEDGREADITPEEVAYYGTIGFRPVDGQPVPKTSAGDKKAAAPLPEAVTGTDLRLDALTAEIRGLRADFASFWAPNAHADAADGASMEIREPAAGNASEPQSIGLSRLNKDELVAKATELGVTGVESLQTKQALIDAIKSAQTAQE